MGDCGRLCGVGCGGCGVGGGVVYCGIVWYGMGCCVVCCRRWCSVGQVRVTSKVMVTAKVKSKVIAMCKVKVMPKVMVISSHTQVQGQGNTILFEDL